MILILSQDGDEATTEIVMDWIDSLGGDCLRLNGEDFNEQGSFSLSIGQGSDAFSFRVGGREFTADHVDVVWLRRYHRLQNLGIEDSIADQAMASEVSSHLTREIGATIGAFYQLLADTQWLTRPREVHVSKVRALRVAAQAGLAIPETIVTNDKRRLREFRDKHGKIITKTLSNGCALPADEGAYFMYTSELSAEDVRELPDFFFPSLAQEMLEKAYEIRVFYLDGSCYAMAIFSQLDSRTSADFRRYNHDKPNRTVPYELPREVTAAIRRFMSEMELATGSLDIVRTKDDRHVFLEVNPVGQLGMVSYPCNYRLEKRIAEYLIERSHNAKARTAGQEAPN